MTAESPLSFMNSKEKSHLPFYLSQAGAQTYNFLATEPDDASSFEDYLLVSIE